MVANLYVNNFAAESEIAVLRGKVKRALEPSLRKEAESCFVKEEKFLGDDIEGVFERFNLNRRL